jgi:hypothetical protein
MGAFGGRTAWTATAWHRSLAFALYAGAALSYAAAGVAYKPLLNWIVGPVWIVLVVGVLPDLGRRLRGGRR